jgi:hypothetical protein
LRYHTILEETMLLKRLLQFFAVAAAAIVLVGCKAGSDYPRGQFSGYVINHTEDEIVAQVGKPAEVDNANPDRPIWVYHKKTFDVDNYNKVDDKTLVYMKKNEAGKLVGQDTSFQ